MAALVLKEPDYVAMVIKGRVSDHQAKEAVRIDAERMHIASQEREKAEAEIAAATAAAQAEAARASAEAIAKAQVEAEMSSNTG